MFSNFKVDLLSFLLGFIASSLFWWLVSRFRPLIPAAMARLALFIKNIRQRNLEGAAEFLRKDTIRRAQKRHLAAAMFALDEILIPPMLLAPPLEVEPDMKLSTEAIASQIIPYMPDWPEMAAGQGAASISIAQAIQNGCSIAVIGQPGSGKSVALASFACQLARNDPALGDLRDYLPIYCHILDLTALPANRDPLPSLLRAVGQHVAVIYQAQLSRLINDRLSDGQVVIILDGIDELPPTHFHEVVEFLKAVREKFPGVRIVIAGSPYFQDGLTALGIVPLGLSAWGPAQRNEFLDRWSSVWEKHIAPEAAKIHSQTPVTHLLIDHWLKVDRGFPTPLEWTLRVWGAYAGDLASGSCSSLQTLTDRLIGGFVTRESLAILAREFLIRKEASIAYSDLEKLLTGQSPETPAPALISDDANPPDLTPPQISESPHKAGKSQKGKRDVILTKGEQILESLVKAGVLMEHGGSRIRFISPVILGYLAAPHLSTQDIPHLLDHPYWSANHQALRFVAARGQETAWIEPFLQSDPSPIFQPLLAAARWLSDSPGNAPWRGGMFRSLLNGIQNEQLPVSLRARMAAAFVCSNDPSVPKLFKQLLSARMPVVRQLAVLALGAWGDPAMVGDLINLIGDIEQTIRNSACLALVSLHTDSALNSVADVLLNGDELLRQTAAESLVYLPVQGADIIREASKVQDLLTRRAAVFGLLQIREPWSKEILEKMAVEDGQWVVRNAAAQALEAIQVKDPRIPRPLPLPHESPWLVGFAGKRGIGLSAYQSPVDVIMLALQSGTAEDQMVALRYLKDYPEENVILAVYNVFYGEQVELKDAALITIWQWTMGGIKLPDPTAIGVA